MKLFSVFAMGHTGMHRALVGSLYSVDPGRERERAASSLSGAVFERVSLDSPLYIYALGALYATTGWDAIDEHHIG
jgi:hypothetical protein